MTPHSYPNSKSGMTLVETIVSIGIFGIVVMSAIGVMRLYSGANAKIEDYGETYDLRQYVRNSIDCAKTFDDSAVITACNDAGGAPIDVKDSSGNILISKNDGETNLFDHKMRASCRENGGTYALSIDFIKLTRDGHEKKDPLRPNLAITWQNLTDNIPILCNVDTCASGKPTFRSIFGNGVPAARPGEEGGVCPMGSVAVAVNDWPVRQPAIACCPLKVQSALIGPNIKVKQTAVGQALCPANSVVTGVSDESEPTRGVKGGAKNWFCRAIDTTLYTLSTPAPIKGYFLGNGAVGAGNHEIWSPAPASAWNALNIIYRAFHNRFDDSCIPQDPNQVITGIDLVGAFVSDNCGQVKYGTIIDKATNLPVAPDTGRKGPKI